MPVLCEIIYALASQLRLKSGLTGRIAASMVIAGGRLWAVFESHGSKCNRPICPQVCRSEDLSERPLPFNAELQAKLLEMTTSNDRHLFQSRHLTKRLR